MISVIVVLISLLVAWLLISPHLKSEQEAVVDADASVKTSLLDQKDRCLQLLRDVELDYATGKIGDEEHRDHRSQIEQELESIYAKLDASEAKETSESEPS